MKKRVFKGISIDHCMSLGNIHRDTKLNDIKLKHDFHPSHTLPKSSSPKIKGEEEDFYRDEGTLEGVFNAWINRDMAEYRRNLVDIFKMMSFRSSTSPFNNLWSYYSCETRPDMPDYQAIRKYRQGFCGEHPQSPQCRNFYVLTGQCRVNNPLWIARPENAGEVETSENLTTGTVFRFCQDHLSTVQQLAEHDNPGQFPQMRLGQHGASGNFIYCWYNEREFADPRYVDPEEVT